MTLHIVNTPHKLQTCLAQASDNDAVVLIEEAVTSLQQAVTERNINLYGLKEDLTDSCLPARDERPDQLISVEEFVQLCETHHPIVSW